MTCLKDQGSSLYLLSIAYMLQREFPDAEKMINKVIGKNAEMADYFFIRALIKYWSAVPGEVFDLANTICPEVYFNGIYFLPENKKAVIKDAASDFKLAYNRADNVQDLKKRSFFNLLDQCTNY